MKTKEPKRLPEELTITEAAAILGRDRSNIYRKFRKHLRKGSHNKRAVWLVPMRVILESLTDVKSDGFALPEIDDISMRVAALQKIMERYAEWAAKMAQKYGIPV